ncbi:uncharacterized protein LOC110717533 [Chenopodium quinoa]|uniref:uncharacterized protein LOC110717533 n=1 Tax=Chenopodium quinoa TaxID=63459 RepID=UPI000B77C7DD|nr:uncharacterized protein LOC110717533 [Chenopodium quinoa]
MGEGDDVNTDDNNVKTSVVNTYHPAFAVTNIRSLVPLILDGDKVLYNPWATLFRNSAKVYNVLDHIDPKVSRPTDIKNDLWERLDAVVLQWLYGAISTEFLYRILDEKATDQVVWDTLRNLFQDNKGTRVVHLENQFGSITLASCVSLADYCHQLKTVSNQLAAIGHPIFEERLVLQLAGKLTPEYGMVATLIQQGNPLPSFSKACSMLELDRVSLEKNKIASPTSSTVLLAASDASHSSSQPHNGGRSSAGAAKPKGGKKNSKGGGSKGGAARGSQHNQNQMQQYYFPPWAAYYPPCPYPSMPMQWRAQSRQQQPPVPPNQQGLLGPTPRQPNAAFLATGSSYQPTDLPAFFNT